MVNFVHKHLKFGFIRWKVCMSFLCLESELLALQQNPSDPLLISWFSMGHHCVPCSKQMNGLTWWVCVFLCVCCRLEGCGVCHPEPEELFPCAAGGETQKRPSTASTSSSRGIKYISFSVFTHSFLFFMTFWPYTWHGFTYFNQFNWKLFVQLCSNFVHDFLDHYSHLSWTLCQARCTVPVQTLNTSTYSLILLIYTF